MIPYVILNCMLLANSLWFALRNKVHRNTVKNVYLFTSGLWLVLFAGFRGDFTSDYKNYAWLFRYYNQFDFSQILERQFGQEIGYVFINRLIGVFSNNVVWVMLITSCLIVVLFLMEIRRDSVYVWLSVFMFVTIGQYFTSFNLIRQILAAAIVFSGSKYMYERNFIRYFLVVILAALFHKTALIMIPFFFVLNLRFNITKLLLILLGLAISMSSIESILRFVQLQFYDHYIEGSYGMTGFGFNSIVLPLAILFFILFHYPKLDCSNNQKVNLWVNAVIFYVFFTLLGLQVMMIQRLSHFFAPYVLLLVPYIIGKVNNVRLRVIYFYGFVAASIAYSYVTLSGSGYDPFYFFWNIS